MALGFLLMIGMTLIADGFGFHVPKGYIYAAMGFSALVEDSEHALPSAEPHEFRCGVDEASSLSIQASAGLKVACGAFPDAELISRGVPLEPFRQGDGPAWWLPKVSPRTVLVAFGHAPCGRGALRKTRSSY